jgi:hypothetical protein
MEYLVAALALLFAVGYAVLIAVNIEKGKSWALEIARAVSMLDPQTMNFELRSRAMEAESEAPVPEVEPLPEAADRLAA